VLQEFNEHKVDVLALAVNENKTVLFSAGVDNKVVMYRLLKGNGGVCIKVLFLDLCLNIICFSRMLPHFIVLYVI